MDRLPEESAPRLRRRLPLLWRNRDYLLLWGGQGVSAVGTQASQLALPLLILAVTRSPAQAGLVGGLRGLAYAICALPAGAFVDRWNRRRLMVLCDLGRALAFGSVPLALATGRVLLPQLYAVAFIEGALYAFFGLAETASLARVVPPAQLPMAISQNDATEAASVMIGPPLGAVLFGVGRALPFVADAVSYALSAISLLFIRRRLDGERREAANTLHADMAEGVQWIAGRPPLRLLICLSGGMNLVYGGWTLLLIELARRLGASSAAIGLIFACGGAGTILGAAITPLVQRRFTVSQIVIGMSWFFALTWPPYALSPNLFVLGAVNAIGFVFVPMLFGTQFSYRLLLLPDALQGRVNSVFWLVVFACQAAGLFLMGLLLQSYGPVRAVWITFAPAIGLALLPTLSPTLRRIGRLAELAAEQSFNHEQT